MNNLAAERVRELLSYDRATGEFRWNADRSSVKAGAVAGHVEASGYRTIRLDGRLYAAHRLAWLHVHGRWPAEQIDHINGDKADNRLNNLREATRSENGQNQRRAHRNNHSSGLLGVYYHKRDARWVARIRLAGRDRHIGHFDSPEAAHAAYLAAKAELHPFQTIALKEGAQ